MSILRIYNARHQRIMPLASHNDDPMCPDIPERNGPPCVVDRRHILVAPAPAGAPHIWLGTIRMAEA